MRSIKTSICHINVAQWFPPNDALATSIARLCVLREDLYIELRGMVDEPIPLLDGCSADSREIYFFRNCIKTLSEIRSAIETLKLRREFIRMLSRQPAPLNNGLQNLSKALTEAHSLVKRLRNDVAGHLPHEALHKGLQQIAPGTKCLLQMGNSSRETHFQFALELIGATMLCHVPFKEAQKEWQETLDTIRKLGFNAIRSIDSLFIAYARIRDLSI